MAAPPVQSATVVVPTYRRPGGLERVLRSLAAQQDPDVAWRVVVVDNDDAPGASALFEQVTAELGLRATLVREARKGASHARNRGVAEVTDDVIVFVDDDVVPAGDWLRTLLAPIVAGRCDGTGGRVVLDPTVTRPSWFDEPALGQYLAAHDPADAERELVRDEFVITASAAFRTDIFLAAGGFDPELGPRQGVQIVNDDVLVCDRFIAAGGRVHHVPAAVVVHDLPVERLRVRYLLRRAYSQGRSDWIYFGRTIGRRGAFEGQLHWAAHEAKARWREGPRRTPVLVHALCDGARLAGAAREAIRHPRRWAPANS